MEKYLLTSQNLNALKRQAKGNFNLFHKLKEISNFENVFIESEIPDFELHINWEECCRPLTRHAAFMPIISPKMYEYQFQYLGSFEINNSIIPFGQSAFHRFSEQFTAHLANEPVFNFESENTNQCNLSWLLDFLVNCEKIKQDRSKNEKLIWLKSSKGNELVLESVSIDKKIRERQVFSFQNNFESVSWQHLVSIS